LVHDPPAADEVDAVRDCIKQETSAVLPLLGDLRGTIFIGTAGTITTLAAMAQGLPVYEAARIHQYRLTLETVRELEQALLARTKAQRRALPGLENGREDVIVAGVLILTTVMNRLERRECVVSDLGLREGVLIDLAERVSGSDPLPA
jgi:exopolyphosphatase/guanosine-5'-triphosphate,3'-diphosphate pyrophosphatase